MKYNKTNIARGPTFMYFCYGSRFCGAVERMKENEVPGDTQMEFVLEEDRNRRIFVRKPELLLLNPDKINTHTEIKEDEYRDAQTLCPFTRFWSTSKKTNVWSTAEILHDFKFMVGIDPVKVLIDELDEYEQNPDFFKDEYRKFKNHYEKKTGTKI